MPGRILLATAYFPPSEYFSLIKTADEICIEYHENYFKQTYRNRCRILASNGIMTLSVPVIKGDHIKALVKDVMIDYSKRWQQVHFRALVSAYSRSPYFQFFSESIERILFKKHRFLIDLNDEILRKCLEIMKLNKCISSTYSFVPAQEADYDFRYRITPKIISHYPEKPHIQVFSNKFFSPGLSILDLIFNMGSESADYL